MEINASSIFEWLEGDATIFLKNYAIFRDSSCCREAFKSHRSHLPLMAPVSLKLIF